MNLLLQVASLSPGWILAIIIAYFSVLVIISRITASHADSASYFNGEKKSKWYVVAFGMLSDSMSGVTFISVPGAVLLAGMGYFQVVIGYFAGYFIITGILLPIYYRLNLTSIYEYLLGRFGMVTRKSGAFFFILSRAAGAAGRLFLTTSVLQLFIFKALHVPFAITVLSIVCLILLYTYKGGIKTLVWTDALQSFLLLCGLILSIFSILKQMHFGPVDYLQTVWNSPYHKIFYWSPLERSFFPKQFIGGLFIAVCMTGLDQNMMQKNLSLRTLGEAQKNLHWYALVMMLVNLLFLSLGIMLYAYMDHQHIAIPLTPEGKPDTDKVFPMLALKHLGPLAATAFIIGLTAATFSSADSVLTTLTTSFYLDIMDGKEHDDEKKMSRTRNIIQVLFAIIIIGMMFMLERLNTQALINTILDMASITYGPILGVFAYGIIWKRKAMDVLIPFCMVASAGVCIMLYVVNKSYGSYKIGPELILINGIITFVLIFITSFLSPDKKTQTI